MFDIPFKLFPPALLAGAMLYGLAVILWLQPLVEERMAEKTLIPACETGLRTIEADVPPPEQAKRREIQNYLNILNATGLGDLPMTRNVMNLARQELDRLSAPLPRLSEIEMDSRCGCSVNRALVDARWGMSLHVGSLLTHTPKEVSELNRSALAIAASGSCGALPWAKG